MGYLDLLAGDADAFVHDVWGRRVLVRELPPGDLEPIFGIDQADHLITQTALRTPQVRLAQDGAVLSESRYTKQATIAGKPMTGLLDPRRVLDLFADGATIVFQGLQRYWDPLRRLVRGLEEQLGHPCQANAYLTPPGAQGFALHKDTHDVFVFQTYGAKEWEIHEDGVPRQVMMVPGTCMYLPTGTPHMARTQDTASLHVTVGINRYVWRDLLKQVVDPALASGLFDAPLPARLFDDPAALAEALRTKLAELSGALLEADVDAVIREREATFGSGRQPLLRGGLLDALAEVGPDTRLRRRDGATCLVRPQGERVLLLLGDRRLSVPTRIRAAVDYVASVEGEFSPAEVPLDEQSALVLTRRLVREGLLEVAR